MGSVKAIKTNNYKLYNEDCLKVMQSMVKRGLMVDSIVSDPPYHLQSIVKRFSGKQAKAAKHGTDGSFTRLSKGFLGKKWDGGDIAFDPETWKLALQVIKPGGYLVLFAAARNVHKMASAVEAAGFIVKDQILNMHDAESDLYNWVQSQTPEQLDALLNIIDHQSPLGLYIYAYGSGFPKGTSIGKSIDKRLKLKRVNGKPASEQAARFENYKTQLKPAYEPIIVAQRPIEGNSVMDNVLAYGTGAMNIDGNRVEPSAFDDPRMNGNGSWQTNKMMQSFQAGFEGKIIKSELSGRYPANIVHDGSNSVNATFDLFGITKSSKGNRGKVISNGHGGNTDKSMAVAGTDSDRGFSDKGNVGRFFYSAKSGKADRNYGLKDKKNPHPTVKPIPLMKHLVSLFMPPDGTVFDPFMGSGSTGIAARQLGFKFLGCDLTKEYFDIAAERLTFVDNQQPKTSTFTDEPPNFSLKKYW